MDAIQPIKRKRKPKPVKSLVGEKFNRLEVMERVERPADAALGTELSIFWRCLCVCGNERIVASGALNSGKAKACTACAKDMKWRTHGMHKTRVYRIWWEMKKRCETETATAYPRYGARGIKVCPEWSASFEAFYADMGEPPTNKHSIDRFPDKNGNYEKSNCRWATAQEQQRNMRSNVLITFRGETKTMIEWSEITGINKVTLQSRIKKGPAKGWTIERALTEPANQRHAHRKPAQASLFAE